METKKSKIVYKTSDEKWERLRTVHRTKYPNDKNNMNVALDRAVEEFVKNGQGKKVRK